MVTTPAFGAFIGISIFIDSMTSTSSSAATCAPFCAVRRSTRPGIGALKGSPAPPAAGAAAAGAARPSFTA